MAIERRKDSKNRVLKEGEYQRKSGSYEFRWRDRRGKRHSIYAPSIELLREKEISVKRDILDGIKLDNNLTINDIYYRWIKVKRGLKNNTFENYKYIYELFVEQDFGTRKLNDVKKSDVRAYYNFLKENRKLKLATLDNIHTVLHQVFALAVDDEYIRSNPSDNALKELKRAYAGDSKKRRALTVQQQEVFLNYVKNSPKYERWYPVFGTMLWTGMRLGELIGLRWCDIDFENNFISVNHTLIYYSRGKKEKCTFAINAPKTEAGIRQIPMLPVVREAILKEKEYQELTDVTCQAVIDGYTDFVFLNRFGNTHNQTTLNKALDRIIRDCNFMMLDKHPNDPILLPNFSCHILRHTFATRLVDAKVSLKAMMEILGHTDVQTTMNIYAEASKEHKEDELESMSEFYGRFVDDWNNKKPAVVDSLRPNTTKNTTDTTGNTTDTTDEMVMYGSKAMC